DVDVEVAHYGAKPIENAKAVWRITATSLPPISLRGEWEGRTIPIAKNIPLGKISTDLSKLSPGEYKLTVTVAPASFFKRGTRQIAPGPGVVRGVTYFENEWNFWVFPEANAAIKPINSSGRQACPPSSETDILIT